MEILYFPVELQKWRDYILSEEYNVSVYWLLRKSVDRKGVAEADDCRQVHSHF